MTDVLKSQKPADLEKELATLDAEIAQSSNEPSLLAKRKAAVSKRATCADIYERARKNAVRDRGMVEADKATFTRAKSHLNAMICSVDRLESAAGERWGSVDAIDSGIRALKFYVENFSKKSTTRKADADQSERIEKAASAELKLAQENVAAVEKEIAAIKSPTNEDGEWNAATKA